MGALYFYLIQSRQNILLCKNQNNFFIAVRERQTEPGFGQLNQNILYFCISYIPHNFAPFVRVLWDVGDAVSYGIVAYNPHFSETLFYILAARRLCSTISARGWSSGTLAAAAMTFVSGGQYRSGNVDYQFFPRYETERLIKFSL